MVEALDPALGPGESGGATTEALQGHRGTGSAMVPSTRRMS